MYLFGYIVKHSIRSEAILAKTQRVFKSFDNFENGYIPKEQFSELFAQLSTDMPVQIDAHGVAALASNIETPGAGIILWDDLWKSVSRLMVGTPLQAVLSGPIQTSSAPRPRSDSDIARELQAELNGDGPSTPQTNEHMDDYEFARKLQAELNGTTPVRPATPPPPTSLHRHDSLANESTGTSFTMFHYNGLTSGQGRARLVEFTLTKRSDEDIIGMAVPLGTSGGLEGALDSQFPIEDVLRTKWPGATVNWQNQTPPRID